MKNSNSHTTAPAIPSYQDIAQETFGTLWQEALPGDWALVVYKLRRELKAKSDGPTTLTAAPSARDEALEEAAREPARASSEAGAERDKLRAVLEGLECEQIELLMTQMPPTLRAVAQQIAMAAKLGAHLMPQQRSATEGREG